MKEALTQQLVDARNQLLGLVRDLPPDVLQTAGAVGEWSIQDVVGHLASWEHRLLTWVQMVRDGHGDQIDWSDSDEEDALWNRAQYLRKRAWTWDETIRELALLREEVLWNIAWAEPDELFRSYDFDGVAVSMASLLQDIAEHDQEHTAQIRAWLAGRGAPAAPPERQFTEMELRQYNGERGARAYIAYDGVVYDVTDAPTWRGGMHRDLHYAGLDLTRSLRKAPHDTAVFTRVPCVGVMVKEERSK